MPTESNSFEIILKALMDDFGGPEIFSEENEPRLTKALKSIEGLFAKEKKQLLMACMENVPQTMYSAVGLPPKEQQAKVDVCLEKLNELGVAKEVVEAILLGFIGVLKLNAKATKTPEFEKIMGEMEIDGEIYKTCQIGKQIWTAENLRMSAYGSNTWDRGRTYGMAVPGYKYGRVYTRWDASYYDNVIGKNGWRLPSVEDWLEMVQYIESLGFDAGTALKSKNDWNDNADPGLDLFGFAAHPIKFWDDNLPKKEKLLSMEDDDVRLGVYYNPEPYEGERDVFYSLWKEREQENLLKKQKKLEEENGKISLRNAFIEISTVSHFPCVQFWTSTKYADNPCVDYADDMAYVATIGEFNNVSLDNGKISTTGRVCGKPPFGFACVRFVKDVK